MSADVFIIHSPLIALICNVLMSGLNRGNYIIVYVYRNKDKDGFYFKRLSHANISMKYFFKNGRFLIINMFILSVKLRLKYQKVNVYVGQVKSPISRLFLFGIKKFNLYTVDEGYSNIFNNLHGYYQDDSERKLSTLFFSIFDKNFLYKNIRKTIVNHYTIFRCKNVFYNTIYISLVNTLTNKDIFLINELDRLNVLLLTNKTESQTMLSNDEKTLYEIIIDKYSIDKIIPHPGSKFDKLSEKNKNKLVVS